MPEKLDVEGAVPLEVRPREVAVGTLPRSLNPPGSGREQLAEHRISLGWSCMLEYAPEGRLSTLRWTYYAVHATSLASLVRDNLAIVFVPGA